MSDTMHSVIRPLGSDKCSFLIKKQYSNKIDSLLCNPKNFEASHLCVSDLQNKRLS